MKKLFFVIVSILLCASFLSCTNYIEVINLKPIKVVDKLDPLKVLHKNNIDSDVPHSLGTDIKNEAVNKYKDAAPGYWGEKAPGVKTAIDTESNIIALTFDACGGKGGNGYDKELIDYLDKEHVPAALFINSRWIDENYDTFMKLSKDPLFEIENHGTSHLPLSVNGKSAYGIEGTGSLMDVINEVVENEDKIENLTGRRPKYFRSGTAYYDEIAVKVAEEMGVKVMGFDIIGDAGATYSKSQIKRVCSNVKPGSILIFHMNHPEKETAEGIMEVVPLLRSKGFDFVKLEDYDSSLK